ncbi:MAG: hypothetical protein WKG07_27940 [Hymenobacter sp.]
MRCRDNEHLCIILPDIQQLEGVEQTETLVVLNELFSRPIVLSAE